MHDGRVARDDVAALLRRDHRVLEEAAGVADHRRVGQLGAADLADPVVHLARRRVADAGVGHPALQVQVAQHRGRRLRQAQPHAGDQAAAGERLLEHAVAVAEAAGRGVQRERGAGLQVDGVERVEAVLQLHAVGTDVLHRRGAHATGDQRQVLQPRQALLQRPGDELVPVLAGAGLDDDRIVPAHEHAAPGDLDLEHQRAQVTRQHDVAAAAQHEPGQTGQIGVGQQALHVLGCVHAHEPLGQRGQAEAVVRPQADIGFDGGQVRHGRIFADLRLRKPFIMPSFDTVLEPNLVEVRNAVDQSSKEIGTRFDFKGSSARVELKDKDITLYADSDFQLSQVMDILTLKLTKRSVDARFLDSSAKIEKIGGDKVKQVLKVKEGIDSETAKKIQQLIKASKMKVQAAIQGDAVRVTGAKRDDLQAAMALIRKDLPEVPLSFNNFRD